MPQQQTRSQKTTQERADRKLAEAKMVLQRLQRMQVELQQIGDTWRHARVGTLLASFDNELREIVGDDEAYTKAAAELWLPGASTSAGIGNRHDDEVGE